MKKSRQKEFNKLKKDAARLMADACSLEADALKSQNLDIARRVQDFRAEVLELQSKIKAKEEAEQQAEQQAV